MCKKCTLQMLELFDQTEHKSVYLTLFDFF